MKSVLWFHFSQVISKVFLGFCYLSTLCTLTKKGSTWGVLLLSLMLFLLLYIHIRSFTIQNIFMCIYMFFSISVAKDCTSI